MTPNDPAAEMPDLLCPGSPVPTAPLQGNAESAFGAFIRRQWPTLLVVLLGGLVVLNAVVDVNDLQAKKVAFTPPIAATAVEAKAPLQQAIAALEQTESSEMEKFGALMKVSKELDELLEAQIKVQKNKARIATLQKMRQNMATIAGTIAVSPGGENGEGARISKASADLFKAELAEFENSLPDREFVNDASCQLAAALTLGDEIRSIQGQRAAALDKLTGVRNELQNPPSVPPPPLSSPNQGLVWDSLHSSLTMMLWVLTLVTSAAICYGKVVSTRARRSLVRPVAHVVEIAQAITSGRTRSRISAQAMGDLRDLADAFNQMIDALQEAEARLQTAHTSLEFKVGARTAELWKANKALREESELRLRAERDFQQAQKMDALGKLAGSIAHDFNNILTVIIGGAEYARMKLGVDHQVGSMLRTIEQAGERAAGLTRQMLTFSRNEVLSVETVSLNEASNEAGRMLQRLLGLNIELRLELSEDVCPIRANANQVQQVLINLAINARDAMDGMGILTIATRNTEVNQETASRNGVAWRERWVELSVRDTGCGMDAATKARIFEPFFTTKPKGKGTGFGLATVFGIVRQNGGFIDVESAPGQGAVFQVFLPAAAREEEANVCAVETQPESQEFGGNETLLLVDDEEDIRELATITLEGNGYRVLSVSSAEEAIALAEKNSGEIHALITDVVMPGMTGVQLATILTKLIPTLSVLFVSGHSNESITEDTLVATRGDYLQKPYLGKALIAKVQEMLKRQKETAISLAA